MPSKIPKGRDSLKHSFESIEQKEQKLPDSTTTETIQNSSATFANPLYSLNSSTDKINPSINKIDTLTENSAQDSDGQKYLITEPSLLTPTGDSEKLESTEASFFREDSARRIIPISVGKTHVVGLNFESSSKVSNYNKWNGKIGESKTADWSRDLKNLKQRVGWLSLSQIGRKIAIFGIFVGIFLILAVSAVVALGINQYNQAPNISQENLFRVEQSSTVYARDGKTEIFKFFGQEKRQYVDISRIPENMQWAIIALEDRYFYRNEVGIPWKNLGGAIVDCVGIILTRSKEDCRGASGLAQQLVKNVTKDDAQTASRKIRELFTAIKLHEEGVRVDKEGPRKINKQDIIELYLNWVFFGRNAAGVQEASRVYFGHDIDAKDENGNYLLTNAKACYLAALPQSPSLYAAGILNRESSAWKKLEARKNECLEIMAGQRYDGFNILGDGASNYPIPTLDQLNEAKKEEVKFIEPKFEDKFPHFREFVQLEIVKFLEANGLSEQDLYRNGYKIITTLDPQMQTKVEEIVRSHGDKIRSMGGNNASAMVLDQKTGEILVMVGSLDYNNTEINGKVNIATTPQQPGSSIKPYVYASAFNQGFNPGTVLMDVRTTFEGNYRPDNFSLQFRGPTTIRYALANSLNIPAVKALYLSAGGDKQDLRSALDNWFEFNRKVGLRFPCVPGADNGNFPNRVEKCDGSNGVRPEDAYKGRCFLSAAIGGCEIDMVSHITGINTLLNEGNLRTASPFISIKANNGNGEELYTPENRNKIYPHLDKAIDPLVARQITQVLSDQNRPEFGSYQPLFTIPGWKLAAKTGTTDRNIDTWMVGGSPVFTATVWAGRTDNKPMSSNVQASNLAAPIWHDIMKAIHEPSNLERLGKPKQPQFFSTEGLKQVYLEPNTGFLADGRGNVEWLSDKQIQILEQAEAKLAKPDYEPRTKNIFENRSAIVSRKLAINTLDGKLAVEGKTPERFIRNIVCIDIVGEFPDNPGWMQEIRPWMGAKIVEVLPNGEEREVLEGGSCPREFSDLDAKSSRDQPEIVNESNLQSGQVFNRNVSFGILAGANRRITKASIKINGFTFQEYSDSRGIRRLSFSFGPEQILQNTSFTYGDSLTLTIEAEDDVGAKNSLVISDLKLIDSTRSDSRNANRDSPNNNNNNTNNNTTNSEPKLLVEKTVSLSKRDIELTVVYPKEVASPELVLKQNRTSFSCQGRLKSQDAGFVYSCRLPLADFEQGKAQVLVSGTEISTEITLTP